MENENIHQRHMIVVFFFSLLGHCSQTSGLIKRTTSHQYAVLIVTERGREKVMDSLEVTS